MFKLKMLTMKKALYIYISLILCAASILASAGSVLALSSPTSIAIQNATAFENVFEAGDMLFLVTYNLNFSGVQSSTTQSTLAQDAYSLTLYDSVLSTLFASRPLLYFGYNIQALYFSHSQVVSLGLVWGSTYSLRITINPAFGTPLEGTNQATHGLGNSDWIASTSISNNNAVDGAFAGWIVKVMQDLEINQGVALGTYVNLSTSGLVISTLGRALLLQVVPGIDSTVPTIFNTSINSLGTTGKNTNPNTNLQHSVDTQQILGSTFEQEKQNISAWMGISKNSAGGIVAFFIMALMFGIAFFVIRDTTSAMLITFALSIVLAGVGLFPINLLFALLIAAAAYMLFLIFRFVF